MSLRVFLALDLELPIKNQLSRLQNRLDKIGADVRWVKPEHIHLTMKFLGEISDQMAVDICRLCQNVSAEFEPFEFEVRSAGCFANHGLPRVVWIGIDDPSGCVRRLHQRIEKTLAPLGLRREHRAFKPHVTLGRVRSARNAIELRAEVVKNDHFEAGITQASEITIYSSQLSPQGPVHTVIGRAKFGTQKT
ncbi:MAG: RNA 2',3'-cyclic phosphodiesterase [Phycisphaerae bacterium]|nr:RNA 2',3'-cyclic phosphodiesterase [Phycisphaerae bacterium]